MSGRYLSRKHSSTVKHWTYCTAGRMGCDSLVGSISLTPTPTQPACWVCNHDNRYDMSITWIQVISIFRSNTLYPEIKTWVIYPKALSYLIDWKINYMIYPSNLPLAQKLDIHNWKSQKIASQVIFHLDKQGMCYLFWVWGNSSNEN